MPYAKYRPINEVVRPTAALWRLGLGAAIAFCVTILWLVVLLRAVDWTFGHTNALPILDDTHPFGASFWTFTLTGLGIGTLVAARLLHKRGFWSLVGRPSGALRGFVIAGVTTVAVAIPVLAFVFLVGDVPVPNLDPVVWLNWVPTGILVILLQTGSEELFFRGYLQNQLAARFRNPLTWIGLPTVLFAAGHFVPGQTTLETVVYMASAGLFGLVAADLTARTGNLGAAWGFHFANNVLALQILAQGETMYGMALFRSWESVLGYSPPLYAIAADALAIIVIWLLLRRLLSL